MKRFASFVVAGPEDAAEYRAIRKLSIPVSLNGNQGLKLLIEGKATFDSMEAGIGRAGSGSNFQPGLFTE